MNSYKFTANGGGFSVKSPTTGVETEVINAAGEFNANPGLANDSVTTVKILAKNVTTAKLDDAAVTTAKIDPTLIQYAEVAIASADIVATTAGKLGHANGVALVAGPGSGKILELVSAVLIYDYAGAGYGAGGNVNLAWTGTTTAVTGVVSAANSLGATADKVVQFLPLAVAGNALPVNTGLSLVAATAFTLGSATGVVRVKVAYRVHTSGLV